MSGLLMQKVKFTEVRVTQSEPEQVETLIAILLCFSPALRLLRPDLTHIGT